MQCQTSQSTIPTKRPVVALNQSQNGPASAGQNNGEPQCAYLTTYELAARLKMLLLDGLDKTRRAGA